MCVMDFTNTLTSLLIKQSGGKNLNSRSYCERGLSVSISSKPVERRNGDEYEHSQAEENLSQSAAE